MVIGFVVIMRIKMYQKVRYTCRVVVLMVKPLVCLFFCVVFVEVVTPVA